MTLIPILISYFAMRESWIPAMIRERRWAGAYLRLFEQTGIAAKVHPALVYGVFVLVPMFFAWYLAVIAHGWLFVVLDFMLAFLLLPFLPQQLSLRSFLPVLWPLVPSKIRVNDAWIILQLFWFAACQHLAV